MAVKFTVTLQDAGSNTNGFSGASSATPLGAPLARDFRPARSQSARRIGRLARDAEAAMA